MAVRRNSSEELFKLLRPGETLKFSEYLKEKVNLKLPVLKKWVIVIIELSNSEIDWTAAILESTPSRWVPCGSSTPCWFYQGTGKQSSKPSWSIQTAKLASAESVLHYLGYLYLLLFLSEIELLKRISRKTPNAEPFFRTIQITNTLSVAFTFAPP